MQLDPRMRQMQPQGDPRMRPMSAVEPRGQGQPTMTPNGTEREQHVPQGNAYGWHRRNDADPAGNMPGQRPAEAGGGQDGQRGYEREGFRGQGPNGEDGQRGYEREGFRGVGPNGERGARGYEREDFPGRGLAFGRGPGDVDPAMLAEVIRRRRMQHMAMQGGGAGSPDPRLMASGGGGMRPMIGGGFRGAPSDPYTSSIAPLPYGNDMVSGQVGGGMQPMPSSGYQAAPSDGIYAGPQPSFYDLLSYQRQQ